MTRFGAAEGYVSVQQHRGLAHPDRAIRPPPGGRRRHRAGADIYHRRDGRVLVAPVRRSDGPLEIGLESERHVLEVDGHPLAIGGPTAPLSQPAGERILGAATAARP